MNINDRCKQAKKDIDSGFYDWPTKKKRMKIVLRDFGNIGKFYMFDGKYSSNTIQQYRIKKWPKQKDYEAEFYKLTK